MTTQQQEPPVRKSFFHTLGTLDNLEERLTVREKEAMNFSQLQKPYVKRFLARYLDEESHKFEEPRRP